MSSPEATPSAGPPPAGTAEPAVPAAPAVPVVVAAGDEDGPDPRGDIGWIRAIVTGVAIVVVGFAGTLLVANRILTKALGLTRDGRQWLSTGVFIAVVVVMAWALRWLQERRLI